MAESDDPRCDPTATADENTPKYCLPTQVSWAAPNLQLAPLRYSREQLTRFGANAPAEGLRHLPSFIGNTETENKSARGTGAAQVNLRALGSQLPCGFRAHCHQRGVHRVSFHAGLGDDSD